MTCIEHTQQPGKNVYGVVWHEGRNVVMHRLVYADNNGTSLTTIANKVIRHTCDNKRCINPEHLVLGTQADNMADKVSRNRQAKGETHGMSKLTNEQVKYIKEVYKPRCPKYSGAALARKIGVHYSTISDI